MRRVAGVFGERLSMPVNKHHVSATEIVVHKHSREDTEIVVLHAGMLSDNLGVLYEMKCVSYEIFARVKHDSVVTVDLKHTPMVTDDVNSFALLISIKFLLTSQNPEGPDLLYILHISLLNLSLRKLTVVSIS